MSDPVIATNVALLAPVPAEHLVSALEVLKTQNKVAFGSAAFLVFDKLESLRHVQGVDVYIYASGREGYAKVSPFWRAVCLGFVPSNGGAHPDGMKYRPKSTENYPQDNSGHWGLFWEVKDLRPAEADDWCPIPEMVPYGN